MTKQRGWANHTQGSPERNHTPMLSACVSRQSLFEIQSFRIALLQRPEHMRVANSLIIHAWVLVIKLAFARDPAPALSS